MRLRSGSSFGEGVLWGIVGRVEQMMGGADDGLLLICYLAFVRLAAGTLSGVLEAWSNGVME